MNKKLLYFVRSLIYSIQNNCNILFFNEKKGSSFRIQPYRLLFAILFVLFSVNFAGAQSASATWALTGNGNSANVGNVTGAVIGKGSTLANPTFGTNGAVSTGWSDDASSRRTNEFYEFAVTPGANVIFNATAINFEHSVSNGTWVVQAYYSTDNFATSTAISSSFASNGTITLNNNSVAIPVDNATLKVRIYGWDSDGSGRTLRIRNFVISGTTCAKANAGVDQYSINSSFTLAANTPTTGTGTWSVASGPSTSTGQFSNVSSPTAIFMPIGSGTWVLNWTINGCGPSTDQVVITNCSSNLITNGDFSNAASGWTPAINSKGPTSATSYVEVLTESIYFSNSNTDNTAELDSQASLGQSVTVIPNVPYTLSFLYARRPGSPASVAVDVRIIGGATPATKNLTSSDVNSTPELGTFEFTPTSSSITIEFYNSLGTTTLGSIIDNIVLVPSSQVVPVAITNPKGNYKTLNACSGTAIALDVDNVSASGVTYLWSGSAEATFSSTTIKNPTVTFSSSGVIEKVTVVATTAGGCSSSSSSTFIYVNPKPTATAGGLVTVCQSATPGAITLTGASVGGTATTGAWSITSGGGTLSSQAQTATPASVTYTPAANYTGPVTLLLTSNGSTGCTGATSSRTINVNALSIAPTSITGTTIICNGTQTILTAAGGTLGTGANYQWGTGSVVGTSPIAGQTGSTLTITPTISTTYWVRIVNTTSPCTSTTGGVTQLVTVNTPSVAPTSITGTTIICNGTQTILTATGGTLGAGANYQWGTGSVVGTSPIAGQTGSTLTITPTISTTYWVRIVNTTSPCTVTTGGVTQLVTVNQISGDPTSASAGSASVCIGGSTTLTLNGGGGGTDETIRWYTTSCGGTSVGTGNGFSVPPTTTTTYYGRYENGTPCNYVSNCATVTVTVTALPTIPTITITQPTCTVLTGTITVTSPAPGTGFTYSIDGTNYTNVNGIFTVAEDTTYNVTTQNAAGCISPVRSAVVNAASDRVWNGSTDSDWTNPANWTPALVPGNTDCVVIPTTVNRPEIAAGTSVAIHSVTVHNPAILTVKSKAILTVAAGITVATGGDLIFEDDSSLLQTSTDNTINSGHITYKRITTDVRRYDFTCWSSPIHRTPAFTLHDVSPLTLGDKYYSFNPSTGWIISYNGVLPMQQGMGYIVRAPQTYDITTPAQYEASFVGTPNNGTIEITPEANKNILVGNPYASALDAKAFINQNAVRGVDVGSLYFWTHNSPPVNSIPGDKKYYYNTADYAVFNLTGSTASSTNGNNQAPTGFIAAAASFFIKPNSSTNIVFTNSMRVGAGNDQFYKTAKADNEGKNRLWLNFANTEGAFKQALIGYLDGATNEKDYNYDGPTISGNAYVDFYSINSTDKLTIQGRALPFDDSDLVPLGYVSKIVGDFTISIDKADGFFGTQAVYLEDKNTGKITDLRAENYTFTTQKGTFDDRFVLRYTNKTLGTGDFENIDNGLLVSVKDKAIKVTSAKEAIKEVTIFDINGKLLYDKKKVSSSELLVSNLQAANQVLLVKVILENGFTTTKKVVFQ